MIKKYVYKNELYPFFEIQDDVNDEIIELTEEEFFDYERVSREFNDWQEKIREKLE
jgi:hypothetical protein